MGALRQGLRRAQQAASRLLRIVALILFAVTAALAVGLVAVRGVLSSADALHAAADQSGFEARGDTLAADLFLQLAGADAERVADNYPPQTWRAVAEQLLPADWLSQQAHAIIAAFHPWLEGEAAEMPVVLLDLAPVIARLQGPVGAQAILPLLQNRPLCETEPGAAPAIGLEDGLITCLPREANLNAVAGDVASTVAGRLPASYPIGGTGQDGGAGASLQRLQILWTALARAAQLSLRLALFFLVLYTLLVASSLGRLWRSLPTPFLMAGILALLLFAGVQIFIFFSLQSTVSAYLPRFGGEAQQLLAGIVDRLFVASRPRWIALSSALIFAAAALHFSGRQWQQRAARRQATRSRRARRPVVRRQYR